MSEKPPTPSGRSGGAVPNISGLAASVGLPAAPSPTAPAGAGVGAGAGSTSGTSGGAGPGRPSVMQLTFRDRNALYAAYMPVLSDGGLFVPTVREYRLGDDIYLLLSLPDDPQRYPLAGKVAWITPANASGGRTQGVGVRFPVDEKTRALKIKIEEMLGTSIVSAKPTQTI